MKVRLLSFSGLEWSLGHFEYTGDLYLITLSMKQAGRLLQTRKTILEKCAMGMVYVKTVWMHVVADLDQSSLQINDHKINLVSSFSCLPGNDQNLADNAVN